MLIFLFAFVTLAVTTTNAFKVTLYKNNNCTGSTKDVGEIKIATGCQKVGDVKGSVKIEWTDETDNDVVFTAYRGDNCCVVEFAGTLMWQDECLDLDKKQSFRVVGAEDVEKGKKGEDYMCRE